jgi:tetratricopeptide (TPR) repeat protein
MYFAESLEIDSTCAACAFEISKLLLSNESYAEAEDLMEKAVRYSPENKYYITLLSRLYQNNDKGNKAVKVSERLLLKENPGIEDYYFVAQVQMENGLYVKAIGNLNAIENRMGISEGLTFEKFQIYIENEDFQGAENELKRIINKFPDNGAYYIYLGDFYVDRDNYKNAKKQYDKALEIDKENSKVLFSLANYYLETGDTVQFKDNLLKAFVSSNIEFSSKFRRFMPFVSGSAKSDNPLNKNDLTTIFEILIDTHPKESDIYGAYAHYLVTQDKDDKAIELFDKALSFDASQSEVWQEYLFLLSSLRENDLMLEKSTEAVGFFPEEPLFRLFQGVALFQNDDLKRAAETMETGLKYIDENPGLKGRLHAYLGDVYYSLGDVDKCFFHFEEALKIDENNVIVLNNYSYYLSVRGENYDRAERMSSRTIELEPGNATYLDTYAWVLFKKGRYNEAKFIIERAVDNMDVPNGVIIEHYGDILIKTGDVEGALKQWKKAVELEEHSDQLFEKIKSEKYIDEKE